MADRGRYESAMFWLAFGTAAAVVGLALMTIGVTRSPAGADLLGSVWFDVGLGLLVVGGLLLLWALGLYLARRRSEMQAAMKPQASSGDSMAEAVKGYYAERDRLFRLWERREREKNRKG
jgi:hypothetical protein